MADFEKLIDLAAERLGGTVCYASDELLGAKENLLRPGRGELSPGKYTENGTWVDGWESRRRRDDGHDWVIVRLGLAGRLRGVDVDTNHFVGSSPRSIRLEGTRIDGYVPTSGLLDESVAWTEILGDSPLQPGSQNLFRVSDTATYTHLKLHIYPDGGVARLRVYGDVKPNWTRLLAEHRVLDLAAAEHGGVALACSDELFGDRHNLIMPDRSANAGDGWETKRSRRPGSDWAILQLGRPGTLRRVELDTQHIKGNVPESASIEAISAPNAGSEISALPAEGWKELMPRTKLEAHTRHELTSLAELGSVTHVRLNIFPDGGVARLRLFGEPVAS